jgi:predicted kinase
MGAGRPWVVVVTGEPGSGKGTLGRALADSLHVPFLARDEVRMGMFATAGSSPPRERAVDAFLRVVEAMADLGISVVVELIVFRDRPETLARLRAVADCLVVRTLADGASARADRRDRADPLFQRPEVLDGLGFASVEEFVAATARQREVVRGGMVTEFDLPVLTVRTDDGWEPPLPDVVAWVLDLSRRG